MPESINTPLPVEGFIREPRVLAVTALSRSTMRTMVRNGTFPAPVPISPGIVAWSAADVRAWIAEQLAKPRVPTERAKNLNQRRDMDGAHERAVATKRARREAAVKPQSQPVRPVLETDVPKHTATPARVAAAAKAREALAAKRLAERIERHRRDNPERYEGGAA